MSTGTFENMSIAIGSLETYRDLLTHSNSDGISKQTAAILNIGLSNCYKALGLENLSTGLESHVTCTSRDGLLKATVSIESISDKIKAGIVKLWEMLLKQYRRFMAWLADNDDIYVKLDKKLEGIQNDIKKSKELKIKDLTLDVSQRVAVKFADLIKNDELIVEGATETVKILESLGGSFSNLRRRINAILSRAVDSSGKDFEPGRSVIKTFEDENSDSLSKSTALTQEFYDQRVDTDDLLKTVDWIKAREPDLFEPYVENGYAQGISLDKSNWSERYYFTQFLYLTNNFSEKRYRHVVEVRDILRKAKTFIPKPKERDEAIKGDADYSRSDFTEAIAEFESEYGDWFGTHDVTFQNNYQFSIKTLSDGNIFNFEELTPEVNSDYDTVELKVRNLAVRKKDIHECRLALSNVRTITNICREISDKFIRDIEDHIKTNKDDMSVIAAMSVLLKKFFDSSDLKQFFEAYASHLNRKGNYLALENKISESSKEK